MSGNGDKYSHDYCDNIDTDSTETCASLIQQAFDSAVAQLSTDQGADPATWTWPAAWPKALRSMPGVAPPVMARTVTKGRKDGLRPAVAISTFLGAINGYALTKWRFRGADTIFAAGTELPGADRFRAGQLHEDPDVLCPQLVTGRP